MNEGEEGGKHWELIEIEKDYVDSFYLRIDILFNQGIHSIIANTATFKKKIMIDIIYCQI